MDIDDKIMLLLILVGSHVIIYIRGLSDGYKKAYKDMLPRKLPRE